MENRMANAKKTMEEVADSMSGWCAGCGKRLELEDWKSPSVYVRNDGVQCLYLMCDPCVRAVHNREPGYEALLERVEKRADATAEIGNPKGAA